MDEISITPVSSPYVSPLMKEALLAAIAFFVGISAGFFLGSSSVKIVEKNSSTPAGATSTLDNLGGATSSPVLSFIPQPLQPRKASPVPKRSSPPPPRTITYTSPFVHVISPNGGERLCIGSTYKIRWESWGVDTVVLSVRDRYKTSLDYPLGAHRATSTDSGTSGTGYYMWKVGTSFGIPLPASSNYEVYLKSVSGSQNYSDTSDRVITVKHCQ